MSKDFSNTNFLVFLKEKQGERAEQVVVLRQWMFEFDKEMPLGNAAKIAYKTTHRGRQ